MASIDYGDHFVNVLGGWMTILHSQVVLVGEIHH